MFDVILENTRLDHEIKKKNSQTFFAHIHISVRFDHKKKETIHKLLKD